MMSITQDDFKKIWASTSSVPEYTFSDPDYQDGWEFVGNLPPTRAMWDTLQRRNDQKMKYLRDNGSMCFNSVADMVASNLESGQTVFTKGYYSVNDGGSALYTIRAKDVADIDDGGSIIFLDNGNVAELITDDEVNINQFGGKGDGTTDDNVAIVNAVAYASAKNKRLVFLEGYNYYSSQGIVIENPPTEIRMDGALYYKGSGTALTIGEPSKNLVYKIIKLNVIGDNDNVLTVTPIANNGVKLINVSTSQITIHEVAYFGGIGVEFVGDGRGMAYNSVYINVIKSCYVCLQFTAQNTNGWVNENKFFGGRLAVESNVSFFHNSYGVIITSTNGYYNNNNIFYSVSAEHMLNSVKIEYGNFNQFIAWRTEYSIEAFVVDNTHNNYCNYMTTFLGGSTETGLSYGLYGNILQQDTYNATNFLRTRVFDSGELSHNSATSGNYSSCTGVAYIENGNISHKSYNNSYVDIAEPYAIKLTKSVGAVIDTTVNKTFLLDVNSHSKFRIIVAMWDANGNRITNTAPTYNNHLQLYYGGDSAGANQYCYTSGSDVSVNAKLVINLPSNCAKAYIGVRNASVDTYITRFALFSASMCRVFNEQNEHNPVLSAIPTSAGTKGQFVGKETPTLGGVGWVYDGSTWLSVG